MFGEILKGEKMAANGFDYDVIVIGSGYNRLKPVMPHKPMVPAGAPAELRLDAKKEDVIPLYPY
jgi:hypothetical protein